MNVRPEVDDEPVHRLKAAGAVAAQLAQTITSGDLPAEPRRTAGIGRRLRSC